MNTTTTEKTAKTLPGTPSDWVDWMDLLPTSEQDRIALETGFCVDGKINMSKEQEFNAACNQARASKLNMTKPCPECGGFGDIQTQKGTHTCGFCLGTGMTYSVRICIKDSTINSEGDLSPKKGKGI